MIFIDNSQDFTDKIIVLDDNGVFIDSPEEDQIKSITQILKDGTDRGKVKEILSKFDYISYKSIRKVQSNIKSEMVYIKHHNGKEIRSRSISCNNKDIAAHIVRSLSTKLPEFKFNEVQLGMFRSALKPSIYIVVFASLFSFAYSLTEIKDVTISGSNRGVKYIFLLVSDVLGPTGIVVVGFIFIAICIWWLIRRVKNPPLILSLKK